MIGFATTFSEPMAAKEVRAITSGRG